MSKIDQSRFSAIFKGLASTGTSNSANIKFDNKKVATTPALLINKAEKKSLEELKKKIGDKLVKLKLQDDSYRERAPQVVVIEILLWEFGEEFLNSPSFKYLSQEIAKQIATTNDLSIYLNKLLDDS